MKTFARVAERGSLSAAARDLGLSQPAVSQQISNLEDELAVRLINRTTRGLRLTEPGERYLLRVQEILKALAEAEDDLRPVEGALEGLVRLQAPSGFGQQYLSPWLIAFQRRHPGLLIELQLEDRISDLIHEGIDLSVRLGVPRQAGLTVRRLGSIPRVLVASRGYAAQRSLPKTPDQLSDHGFVRFSWAPGGDVLKLDGPQGRVEVTTRPVFLSNNSFAVIDAIRSGLGVGATQLPLVHDLLESGELIHLLPDHVYAALPAHAVYPSRKFIPRRVRALVDHIATEFARAPGVDAPG